MFSEFHFFGNSELSAGKRTGTDGVDLLFGY